MGGEAANFWCPFASFVRVATRFLIVFLKDFAKESLITSDDNINPPQNQELNFTKIDAREAHQTVLFLRFGR